MEFSQTPRDLPVRSNIAPTQQVPIVRNAADGSREMVMARFGLIPSWSKDGKVKFATFNARVETVDTSNTYRSAFKTRRCLMVADGYYEWITLPDKTKQPIRFVLEGGDTFAFAGLWERWHRGEQPITSCAMITCEPNALAKQYHDRMPVILPPRHYDAWLDGSAGKEVLVPYSGNDLRAFPVSKRINNSRVEGDPTLIEPIAA